MSGNTYVRLVDSADNSAGSGTEALYVNTLVVPAGTTLDLNGIHVYTRESQVGGTVLGGIIDEQPSAGAIPFETPFPGEINAAGQINAWTFFGRAGHSVTVAVNPGGGGLPAALAPFLNNVTVSLLDPSGNVLAIASNTTAGKAVTLLGIALPSDGTYTVDVQALSGQPASTGRYMITVNDVTVNVAPTSFGQRYNGTLSTNLNVDRWTFAATAGQQIQFKLVAAANPNIEFTMTGPNGYIAFTAATASSGLITLPSSGSYTLSVDASGAQELAATRSA